VGYDVYEEKAQGTEFQLSLLEAQHYVEEYEEYEQDRAA
jgi:hypothetical protein